MYKRVFQFAKTFVPRISETELIALRSGTSCVDRDIFQGNIYALRNLNKKYKYEKHKWQENDNIPFRKSKVNELLQKYGNAEIYPSSQTSEIFDYIGRNNFLSFIIDTSYGGSKLSVSEISSILTKITSCNPALGVSVMVPNSLGPGELLSHYGTAAQKQYYLPKLANGSFIPCFGLTGPNNGSDAAGSIDKGVVKYNTKGEKVIEVEVNKRYITLAPVANLVGLAFRVRDPDRLLGAGKEGITVALLEKGHEGLLQETHHDPLQCGFPNGTVKGKVSITMDQIIGGEPNIGNGWKMLMECLAAGRGVSLPATANASSKTATYGMYLYSKHRKQFQIPLLRMQGVQEKLVEMVYHTWVIQSSIALTNAILDTGEKPSVLSAIMKQQTTDRAREVLNHGMDVHAGSSICLGENNFMEKFYRAAPVGITVEGSNTLTRNLIIFGQGLNKSHPHLYPVIDSILENNQSAFESSSVNLLQHVGNSYLRSIMPTITSDIYVRLYSQTHDFSHLANIVALKGGNLKSEQFLSANMADIFSNLYLAYSVQWFEKQTNTSEFLTNYCIERLLDDNQRIINRIVSNYGVFGVPILHLRKSVSDEKYVKRTELIEELEHNPRIMEEIKNDVYVDDTALGNLTKLDMLNPQSDTYRKLYNQVIQVGEFPNQA